MIHQSASTSRAHAHTHITHVRQTVSSRTQHITTNRLSRPHNTSPNHTSKKRVFPASPILAPRFRNKIQQRPKVRPRATRGRAGDLLRLVGHRVEVLKDGHRDPGKEHPWGREGVGTGERMWRLDGMPDVEGGDVEVAWQGYNGCPPLVVTLGKLRCTTNLQLILIFQVQ